MNIEKAIYKKTNEIVGDLMKNTPGYFLQGVEEGHYTRIEKINPELFSIGSYYLLDNGNITCFCRFDFRINHEDKSASLVFFTINIDSKSVLYNHDYSRLQEREDNALVAWGNKQLVKFLTDIQACMKAGMQFIRVMYPLTVRGTYN